MHHFKIKGFIDNEQGYGTTQLFNEFAIAKGADLFIDIDSVGGCVHSGLAMFTELRRYANENNAQITTRSSGFVASIATVVFLVGDTRIVNEFLQPFIHEPYRPWTDATTADDFRKEFEDLDKSRDIMANVYSKNTLMTKDQALDIMKNDTWLSAEECLELGFATEIESLSRTSARMVAKYKKSINQKPNKMSKPNKGWASRFAKLMNVPKAELELAGVDGVAIVFPDLEAEGTPAEGDKITVDGDAMFSGEAETDEYIIVAVEGVVTSVVDKTELDESQVIEELLDIIEEQATELEGVQAELVKARKLHNALGTKKETPERKGKQEAPEKVANATAALERIKNRRKNKK